MAAAEILAEGECDVFPVDWQARDVTLPDGSTRYRVTMFGRDAGGRSAAVHVDWFPYFYVELPARCQRDAPARRTFVREACEKLGADPARTLPVTRKSVWGYDPAPPRELGFLQLAFRSAAKAKAARSAAPRTLGVARTYEASVDPLLRLFHVRGLAPAAWVRVARPSTVPAPGRTTRCEVELEAAFTDLSRSPRADRPALVEASWDIEAYSASGEFPRGDRPEDLVIQIATSFRRYGEAEPYLRSVVCLGDTAEVPGVRIRSVPREHQVIAAWLDLLEAEQPDVMMGYNTLGFDWRFLFDRSVVCVDDATGARLVDFTRLGRLRAGGGRERDWTLSSGAFGDNTFFTLGSPGVLQVDLMQVMRREHKLDSYSLNAVSAHFLGDSKLDVPPWEIFRLFRGSPADRARVAEYAAKDTDLPLRLAAKLCVLENLTEMANAACVPLPYLLERGQQIKVFSLVARKARELGFLVPDLRREEPADGGKYEGATVLDAKKGAHFDVVSALDFKSLYPSIIRAHNLCFSTLVMDPAVMAAGGPGDTAEFETVPTPRGDFVFAQGVPSVMPSLLAELAEWREAAKRRAAAAKAEGDDFAATLANGQQLAFKVLANSCYGFCGASRGLLPCVPIAATVTAVGRRMIERTKEMAERLVPGSEVLYGDSVAGWTPCVVRRDGGQPRITTFERLDLLAPCGGGWAPASAIGGGGGGLDSGGKEACELEGVDIWSDAGWTPLERVIRHRYPHPLVRVVTHTGIVDVTADHSLLRPDGEPVSAAELAAGDALMHADLPAFGFGKGAGAGTGER